jgi:hypothetical protein
LFHQFASNVWLLILQKLEVDLCQSAWVRLFNHGLNDKCIMKSEIRLTGKFQPRLTVWHSSYNKRQGKKNSLHMVQFGIWILSGLCHSAFKKTFFQNFPGGWQLATNGYSSHGHFSIQFEQHIVFSFSSKILVLWPLCGILYWLYVPSVLSEARKVYTVKTVWYILSQLIEEGVGGKSFFLGGVRFSP